MDPFTTPFSSREVVGVVEWTAETSERTSLTVYHGCHLPDLKPVIRLKPPEPTTWEWIDQSGTVRQADGLWCTFNPYRKNFFGPFELHFPVSVLEGRKFAIVPRTSLCVLVEVPSGADHEELINTASSATIDSVLVPSRFGLTRDINAKINLTPQPRRSVTLAR